MPTWSLVPRHRLKTYDRQLFSKLDILEIGATVPFETGRVGIGFQPAAKPSGIFDSFTAAFRSINLSKSAASAGLQFMSHKFPLLAHITPHAR